MFDVIAIGESLVQFNPLEEGPLRHVPLFEKHAAGAESNVIIGLSRLGYKTAYITRLGRDEFSKFVLSTLRGEGVNVEGIRFMDGKNCGIFFVQRGYPVPWKSDVLYYRSDSAAKYMVPEDLDSQVIEQSRVLHLTGITPALSKGCKETVLSALGIAKRAGVLVSFDTNYRRKLWSESEASPTLFEIASQCDILLTDPDDARILLGRKPVSEPLEALDDLSGSVGASTVVYKLGASKGLVALSKGEKAASLPTKVPIVDQIGAGDAVVAGFLAGFLAGDSLQRCLDIASACSAMIVMRKGDFENLPDRADLEKWISAKEAGFDVDFR